MWQFLRGLSRRVMETAGHLTALWLLALVALFAQLQASAATVPHDGIQQQSILIAVNQGDRDISLIDPGRGREVARVAEGAVTGHEVAVSMNGRLAFVPIYGDSIPGKPGTNGDQVVVIDLIARRVVHRIRFAHGVRPHSIAMNPHDGLLYVTTELDRTVSIIDPVTFKIVGAIPTGRPQSHMLVISHNGRFLYTANINTGTVSVLDLASRKLVRVIPVAKQIQRISISADDTMVFTADQDRPRMAVIDTHADAVNAWLPLPAVGYGSASTRDGRWLLVTLPSVAAVAVADIGPLKVVNTVPVPPGPHEVLVTPDNKTAFIACTMADDVAEVNLANWSVVASIKVGRVSDGIGWASVAP